MGNFGSGPQAHIYNLPWLFRHILPSIDGINVINADDVCGVSINAGDSCLSSIQSASARKKSVFPSPATAAFPSQSTTNIKNRQKTRHVVSVGEVIIASSNRCFIKDG